MRRITPLIKKIAVVICFFIAPIEAQQLEDTRAVFVGHSLLNYQMPHILEQLAISKGLSLEKAVQVNNGTPLKNNWDNCHESDFSGNYPPQSFACDAIEGGTASGPYNVLVVTDANNSINSNHIWNQTQQYVFNFTDLLLEHAPDGRSFLFTSWEDLHYHSTDWLEAIDSELEEYETIALEAEELFRQQGRGVDIEIIPANLALKQLIQSIELGEVPGLSQRTEIFSDTVHMNEVGNYFMACVVFSAIFSQSPEHATANIEGFWGDTLVTLPQDLAYHLQSLAWDVVSGYVQNTVDHNQTTPPTQTEPTEPTNSNNSLENLTATPHAPTWGISIQWTAPAQQLQYYKLSLNDTLVTALAGDTQSHTLSWLELGISHLIKVQAYDFEHNLVAEGQIRSRAGDSEVPSQPQALSVRRSGDFGLQLDWQPSTDNHGIKHYVIFRNGEPYTHVNNNSFIDSWPPAGQNYYQIQAVDLYENKSQHSALVAAPLINY